MNIIKNFICVTLAFVISTGVSQASQKQGNIAEFVELNQLLAQQNSALEGQSALLIKQNAHLLLLLQTSEKSVNEKLEDQNALLVEQNAHVLLLLQTSEKNVNEKYDELHKWLVSQGQRVTVIEEQLQASNQTNEALEKHISYLSQEQQRLASLVAQLQGAVSVLSSNSGTPMNITVSPTMSTSATAVTTQTTDVTNESNVFFTRSRACKTIFCSLLILGALCKGPEAAIGVGILMGGTIYIVNIYKEALKRAMVIAGGCVITLGLVGLATMLHHNPELSSMAIAMAFIVAGSTASRY